MAGQPKSTQILHPCAFLANLEGPGAGSAPAGFDHTGLPGYDYRQTGILLCPLEAFDRLFQVIRVDDLHQARAQSSWPALPIETWTVGSPVAVTPVPGWG